MVEAVAVIQSFMHSIGVLNFGQKTFCRETFWLRLGVAVAQR
jgi:hypothetical protein